VIEYAVPFDRVRTHGLGNYSVLRFLEDVKGSLVEGVVDLNIGRVGNEGKSPKVSDLSTDVHNKVKESVDENRDIIDG
jgi:hypothetical protein